MIGWIIKNPMIAGAGAVVLGLLALLAVEKVAHAHTKNTLVETLELHAVEIDAWQRASLARVESASKALQLAQAEHASQIAEMEKLRDTATQTAKRRESEARDARRRLAELEAGNVELSEWAARVIPGDMVAWMLEPTTTMPAT